MPQSRNPTAGAALLRVLWQIPLYAIPFGIFFGTIFGASVRAYGESYLLALVFTSVIMLALWLVRALVVPVLARKVVGWRGSFMNEGLLYMVSSLLAAFAAAVLVDRAIIRGFLGGPQRVATFAMYAILFAVMMTAIGMVVQYHKSSIEVARREKELELARRIQHSFLLESFPVRPRFEVHAINVPSREVSGDFYDVVASQTALLLAVADVEGKSIPAALLTAMLQASLRTQTTWVTSAAAIVSNINGLCCRREGMQQFATFFLMRVEEDGRLAYCNAGHNSPILVRAGGGRVLLETGGMMFGVMEEAPFEEGALSLTAGDRVIVYTDGITERANPAGEEFGPERLGSLVASLPGDLSARQVTERVLRALDEFSQGVEPNDDQTLLVLQMRAGPAADGAIV